MFFVMSCKDEGNRPLFPERISEDFYHRRLLQDFREIFFPEVLEEPASDLYLGPIPSRTSPMYHQQVQENQDNQP